MTADRSSRRRRLKGVIWTLVVLVAVVLGGLGYVYARLNGNISGVDINAQLGSHRPQNVDNGSEDILVLGSDSRAGTHGEYGRSSGARSDTAMVVHVYKGHKRASVVSIPRDTLVSRPACKNRKGRTTPGDSTAMFNSAYEVGGPACAVKTVEQMTDIRMDHYVEVDFTGFKKLIDQLGGVKVTTTKAIHDKDSHLSLAPGTHTLHGEQALGLVRTRHAVGDGSDLGRIELQQAFIKALIHRVRGIGVFSDPKKLFDLADTATKSITPDSQLGSVDDLLGFVGSLHDLSARNVTMITLPVKYDPANPNRVVTLQPGARTVWNALRQDRPIPRSATKGSAGETGDANGVVKSAH
ncbi:LCP family protein [Streptomyces sp. 8L]|uniref:LCP family protein n=1 Tax=Streptomyces sp. 8L TaxID=2877242 RepID=UPI001CD2E4F9|nr:LCP family protein [Streptomyces sp. 8L]MCA1220987.1 LCP family protein [Streptomyces sp. 8L]